MAEAVNWTIRNKGTTLPPLIPSSKAVRGWYCAPLEPIIYKCGVRLATFSCTVAELPNLIFLFFLFQLALQFCYIAIFRVPVFSQLKSLWKIRFCPSVDGTSMCVTCMSAVQQWHSPWNLRKMCIRIDAVANKPHAKLLLVIFHVFSLAHLAKSKEFKIMRSFVSFSFQN